MNFKKIPVKTWYLRYEGVIPKIDKEVSLQLWEKPQADQYLELYSEVGSKWGWIGRLLMTEVELKAKLKSEENEIWLFQPKDKTIGFFEIDFSAQGKAEIVYLGLLHSEIGKGYGKRFLNAAITTAGRHGDVVWLHTCEFDHPNALNVYLKAGFKIVQEKMDEEYYPVEFIRKKNYHID